MQSTVTTRDFGPSPDRIVVTMKTVIDHQGIAITTTAGGSYNSTLSQTFPFGDNPKRAYAAARVFYGHVKDCAKAGKGVWQIEAEIAALRDMERAIDPDQIAKSLTDEIDAHHAEVVQLHNDTVTAVQQAAGDGQGWYRARRAARQPARIVHPTRTRVHCKPLTGVELDLIRHHQGGVVTTRPGQSWTVLRAIERRGYGTATYRDGTRIIASIRLNARGLDAAVEQVGVAA